VKPSISQTIDRAKDIIKVSPTSIVTIGKNDLRRLVVAAERTEGAELSMKFFNADAADLEDAHRTIGELKAQLDAVPIDAMLALIGPDDYDFTGLLSDVEKFATWLEAERAKRKVQP
jgi:hypothetical protein